VELLDSFQQLPGGGMATGGHGSIQVHLDGLHHLQGLVDLSMPQKPFRTLQLPHDWVTQYVGLLLIIGRLGQAFSGLL
jgi:hypothetical protein